MDSEKRKREKSVVDESMKKKKTKVREEAIDEGQVDEFFAILRRMQAAIKYFDEKKGKGNGWRTALEAEVMAEHEDDETKANAAADNGVLDLNALPEDDSGA